MALLEFELLFEVFVGIHYIIIIDPLQSKISEPKLAKFLAVIACI